MTLLNSILQFYHDQNRVLRGLVPLSDSVLTWMRVFAQVNSKAFETERRVVQRCKDVKHSGAGVRVRYTATKLPGEPSHD